MSPETAALESQSCSCNIATFGSSKKQEASSTREREKSKKSGMGRQDDRTPAGSFFSFNIKSSSVYKTTCFKVRGTNASKYDSDSSVSKSSRTQ